VSKPPPESAVTHPSSFGVPLRVALAATAVEALALAAAAIGLAIYAATGHRPHDSADLWLVVVMAAIGAAGLGLVVRGIARGRRWARSPAVLTQLIVLPIGGSALGHGGVLAGVPLLVCGLAGLFGLFAPSSSRVFAQD
jgi:O-antigen/teichoic acid export membrane protein